MQPVTIQIGQGIFFLLTVAVLGFGTACSSGTSSSGGGASSSCSDESGDFYVVENASCIDGEGKLSRVNPDDLCKEEILIDLNCPVDFVLSTQDDGIGYLSTRTDGVLRVDINEKTSFVIDNNVTVATTALFLMENLTNAEKEDLCGGNALPDTILFVADEGIDESGAVLRWCLITDDSDTLESNNPNPTTIISTADIENPRGITVQDRATVYVTGILAQTDDSEEDQEVGVIISANVEGSDIELISNQFSTEVKEIYLEDDGTFLVADAGNNAIFRVDLDADTITTLQTDLEGPRDILPVGSGNYNITQFTADNIVQSILDGEVPTTLTTGVTLDGPEGIAQ